MPTEERAPAQRALDAAFTAAPGTRVSFIAFPGTAFSTPHHLAFYLSGSEAFSKLREAILVDARTAPVTAVPPRPWYLTVLQVAEPLHFDYAGLPMKILWALLGMATIGVLGSGLYLWMCRRTPAPLLPRRNCCGGAPCEQAQAFHLGLAVGAGNPHVHRAIDSAGVGRQGVTTGPAAHLPCRWRQPYGMAYVGGNAERSFVNWPPLVFYRQRRPPTLFWA